MNAKEIAELIRALRIAEKALTVAAGGIGGRIGETAAGALTTVRAALGYAGSVNVACSACGFIHDADSERCPSRYEREAAGLKAGDR